MSIRNLKKMRNYELGIRNEGLSGTIPHSTFLIIISAAALVLLLAVPALAAEARDAYVGHTSKAYAYGDFDTVVTEWADYMKKNPDAPGTEILVRRLYELQEYATNFDAFYKVFEELLAKGVKNGVNEIFMKQYLKGYYEEKGLWAEAEAVGVCDGCINDFLVIGPFGRAGHSLHDEVFGPEKVIDLEAEYPRPDDARKKIRWQALPYKKRSTAMSLRRFIRPGGGVVYGLSQFSVEAETDAVLMVEIGGSHKVWLNGRLVLDGDRRNREWLRDTLFVPVHLAKGYNRLLVKTSGYVSIRLVDGTARPLGGVTFEKKRVLHDIGNGAKKAPQIKEINEGALAHYRALVKKEPENPFAHAALGYLAREDGLDAEALEALEEALRLAPDDPFINYFTGRMFESSPLVPEDITKNKAKSCYKKVLAADKKFALAYERLAEYLTKDDKPREAVAELDKILAFNPNFFHAHYAAADIMRSERWTAEWAGRWKKIEQIYPDWIEVLEFKAGYYSRFGNDKKADEYSARIFEREQDRFYFLYNRAQEHLDRGEDEKALAIYRQLHERDPDSDWLDETMLSYYRSRGKYDKAVEKAKVLAARYPEDHGYLKTVGDIYMEAGDVEKAKEYYQKTRELQPAEIKLLRYVQFLDNVDENFAKEYLTTDEELREMMKNVPGKEKYPKASNIVILDETVQKFFKDGSSAAYEHNVYKVLDEQGMRELLNVHVSGETLEVRVIQPSGEIMEPLGFGYGGYTLHGLEVGSFVETFSRVDNESPSGFFSELDKFYYQDIRRPTLKSRYVMIMHKDFPVIGPFERNFGNNVTANHSLSEEGNWRVYSWEARDVPRIEVEQMMPTRDEFMPFTFFAKKHTWEEIIPHLKDSYFQFDLRPTKLLTEAAEKATKDAKGQTEKVKAIYDFCMEEIRKPGWSGSAHATLLSKEGSREVLFLTLLKIAGIEWDVARVSQDPLLLPPVEWDRPRESLVPHTLYRVRPDDGKDIWVHSLREKRRPLGSLPYAFQGGVVYILSKSGVVVERLPRDKEDDRADMIIKEEVDLGSVSANCTLIVPEAYGMKEDMEDAPDKARKNQISRIANWLFPNSTLKNFDFPGLNGSDIPFTLNMSCHVPRFIETSREGVLSKLGVMPLLEMQSKFISKSKRVFPLAARTYIIMRNTARIHISDKYKLKKLPPGLIRVGEFGDYSLSITEKDGVITTERSFTFRPKLIPPEKYPDFIKFCRDIDNAEDIKILLEEVAKEEEIKPKDEPKGK
jgi:tetratricopeptide (TPR) repeat protein